MADYPVHTPETAPAGAGDFMRQIEQGLGFIPNIAGVMAEAPPLLKAYFTLSELFDQTSLTPAERQTVLLAASYENACDYCMAAHSVLADMQGVPAEGVDALRGGDAVPDDRLEALRRFTRAVVATRGWPGDDELAAFAEAGFSRDQALEVVLGVGMKTLSNYTNHLAGTPVDEAFAHRRWQPAD
ncbi:MAG TPA: carboxymuconolactone decarboxylase family protein [Gammaproteobacteria bacterium]|nr:carboxymuconolactone decarboxylase family protein [Gammaproteobacteria bacterium]